MNINTFRRLLADIKNVGMNRVKIKNTKEALQVIKTSLVTRRDVKERWKEVAEIIPSKKRIKSKDERSQGPGRRKGGKYSRLSRKRRWIIKVRALRNAVKILEKEGKINKSIKKLLYKKIKGGEIKSKRALQEALSRLGDING